MKKIGAHVSVSGGVEMAPVNACLPRMGNNYRV